MYFKFCESNFLKNNDLHIISPSLENHNLNRHLLFRYIIPVLIWPLFISNCKVRNSRKVNLVQSQYHYSDQVLPSKEYFELNITIVDY